MGSYHVKFHTLKLVENKCSLSKKISASASTIKMSSPTSVKLQTITRDRDQQSWSLRQNVVSSKEKIKALLLASSPPTLANSTTTKATTCSLSLTLSHLWRELQGSTNWEDLVQPLHPLLRQEIIRYGEFVTACYKAFDLDPNSKRYLNCKYAKSHLFSEAGLGDSGYQITKYIYAKPDINIPTQNGTNCARWIGYVAVSSDVESKRIGRRDILVTFRGTVTYFEWIANLMSSLTPARLDPLNPREDVKVELGFLNLYTSNESSSSKFGLESCREQLLSEIRRIINAYKSEDMSITIAGHSMGSSLGLLLAYDLAELGLNRNGKNRKIPITVFSFAGPRTGNSCFKERCDVLGVKVLRIVNVNDPITKLPGVLFNENFRVSFGGKFEFPWSCSCYAHVGVELALDFFKMNNPSCVHDLDSYLSLLRLPKIPMRGQRGRRGEVDDQDQGGFDFVNRVKEFLSGAQNFDITPWRDIACNIVNLVLSPRSL